MVWKGRFRVEFRDCVVEVGPGECVVVPRGVEHRTGADNKAQVLCFEPVGVLNTGNVRDMTYTPPGGSRSERSRPADSKLPITGLIGSSANAMCAVSGRWLAAVTILSAS